MCAVATWLAAGGWTALAAQTAAAEWQPNGRLHEYARSTIGVPALVDVGVGSVADQLNDEPQEWDDDFEGFAKRFASNAGRNTVEESVRHGLAAVLDRSVTYQRCTCETVPGRTWHALVETVTDRGRDGARGPAIPRFAGWYGGALAEELWSPDEGGSDVLRVGTRGVLFGFLGNVWKEFVGWP